MNAAWGECVGGFRKELKGQGLPLCIQPRHEAYHQRSVYNLVWQIFPLQNCSNAEGILAEQVGSTKAVFHGILRRPCAILYIQGLPSGKVEQTVENWLISAVLSRTLPKDLECFQVPGDPGKERVKKC